MVNDLLTPPPTWREIARMVIRDLLGLEDSRD